MSAPKRKPPAPTKPKAWPQKMWADYDPRATAVTRFQVYNHRSEGYVLELVQFPVLVFDDSPEAQEARRLAAENAANAFFGERYSAGAIYSDEAYGLADAVLAALGFGKRGRG